MPEELFDVVDAEDRVVEQRSRSEVHRLRLRHRAIHILIVGARGELFLQKRSPHKECNPGVWDSSVSGHVEAGESYDRAAVREALEEVGIALEAPPERRFRIEAREETGYEFTWVYRLRHDGPFHLDPVEIVEGRWFDPRVIEPWILGAPEDFALPFRLIWQRCREDDLFSI